MINSENSKQICSSFGKRDDYGVSIPSLFVDESLSRRAPDTDNVTQFEHGNQSRSARKGAHFTSLADGSGRRSLLLGSFIIFHMSFFWLSFFGALAIAPPEPSSTSESSWWGGMKFDDIPVADIDKSGSVRGGPILQIPCGLLMMPTNSEQAATPANSMDETNNVLPLSTMIDSSRLTSSIRVSVLRNNPHLQDLVRRDSPTHDLGTTQDITSLHIPAGSLWLRMGSKEATLLAPLLWVIEDENHEPYKQQPDTVSAVGLPQDMFDLRLGLDFLWQHKAIVDLADEESLILQIDPGSKEEDASNRVSVPFIRPRPTLNLGIDDDEEL